MATAFTLGTLGFTPAGPPSRASGDTVTLTAHITSLITASISAISITYNTFTLDEDVDISDCGKLVHNGVSWYKGDTIAFPASNKTLTTAISTVGIILAGNLNNNPLDFIGAGAAGTFSVANLTNAKIFHGTTWGDSLGATGTLAASNIGTVASTSDLTAGVLYTGTTVDDVVGSATTAAAQLVTDKAAVNAGKADILSSRTILTITGTLAGTSPSYTGTFGVHFDL